MINSPITVPLTTDGAAFTAVQLPKDYDRYNTVFNPISAYTSPKTNWEIATSAAGSDAAPVFGEDGQVYNNYAVKADPDGTIFYAKADASGVSLIVHVGSEDQTRKK